MSQSGSQAEEEIRLLRQRVHELRAYFPHVTHCAIGASKITAGSYYQQEGLNVTVHVDPPLDAAAIERINGLGR
jgi:hypothetical protein